MKNFPSRLKSLRGELSMTEFSKKIGVSVKTYQHYECGRRAPSLDFIEKICHNLEISADWLLGLDDASKPAHVTATDGSVAAVNHSTVTASPASGAADNSRLMAMIESLQRTVEQQQAIIARLVGSAPGQPQDGTQKPWRPPNW